MGDERIEALLFRLEPLAWIFIAAGACFQPPFGDAAGDESAGRMLLPEILPAAARAGRRPAGVKPGAQAAIDAAAADGGVELYRVVRFHENGFRWLSLVNKVNGDY